MSGPGTSCDFNWMDKEGVAHHCDRLDYELVEMFDGGVVRLCPRHRSWAVAMGRPNQGAAS